MDWNEGKNRIKILSVKSEVKCEIDIEDDFQNRHDHQEIPEESPHTAMICDETEEKEIIIPLNKFSRTVDDSEDPLFISDEFLAKHTEETPLSHVKVNSGKFLEDVSTVSGYICHICSIPVASVINFQHHLRNYHRIPIDELAKMSILAEFYNKYKCKICNIQLSNRDKFRSHNRELHPSNSKYSCTDCTFQCSQHCRLKKHISICHTVMNCLRCVLSFPNFKLLSKHIAKQHPAIIRTHKIETPTHFCTICNLTFESQQSVRDHKISVHGNYKCKYCERICTTQTQLTKHIKNCHKDECNLIECDKCSKKFLAPSSFFRHQKEKHQLYYCKNCPQQFSDLNLYRKHVQQHKDLKLYTCEECPFTSVYQHIVNTHKIRLHKPTYKCHLCSYQPSSIAYLNIHLKHHESKNKIYICNECMYRSDKRLSIQSHIIQRHLNFFKHDSIRKDGSKLRSTEVVFEATRNKSLLFQSKY